MKIQEWQSQWNSFNSMKGLMYAEWYRAILEWMEGKRDKPLPPIEASVDPATFVI
jgi:hypothetical protein